MSEINCHKEIMPCLMIEPETPELQTLTIELIGQT